jgi:beta-glucosidase
MKWAKENADALITQWYPGMEGGTALAKVLYGDYNPAGRLPVSVPGDVGALPVYYNHRMPRRGKYVEMPSRALYPFGYGLTYGDCRITDLKADGNSIHITVRNNGSRKCEDVLELYIRDNLSPLAPPNPVLCGFQRIALDAGAEVSCTLKLGSDAFTVVNEEGRRITGSGSWTLYAGFGAPDERTAELTGKKPFSVLLSNTQVFMN